jgi:hypothetical protein
VICIDPGVKACGVAWFDGPELLVAGYVPKEDLDSWVRHNVVKHGRRATRVVIEFPRIYPGSGQQKGDLNDLLNLAAVVGYVEGQGLGIAERVYPSQWKGQVPKKIMTARILSKLAPGELARIEHAGAKDHNTIDAIGIGLWKLGRLG